MCRLSPSAERPEPPVHATEALDRAPIWTWCDKPHVGRKSSKKAKYVEQTSTAQNKQVLLKCMVDMAIVRQFGTRADGFDLMSHLSSSQLSAETNELRTESVNTQSPFDVQQLLNDQLPLRSVTRICVVTLFRKVTHYRRPLIIKSRMKLYSCLTSSAHRQGFWWSAIEHQVLVLADIALLRGCGRRSPWISRGLMFHHVSCMEGKKNVQEPVPPQHLEGGGRTASGQHRCHLHLQPSLIEQRHCRRRPLNGTRCGTFDFQTCGICTINSVGRQSGTL
jgi:hypothetical protein